MFVVCGFVSVVLSVGEPDLECAQCGDGNSQSGYFADAETSSCGSFECTWSDSDDEDGL